jgi:hypothetical protein
VLTHADALDEKVVSGKRAFERHNCWMLIVVLHGLMVVAGVVLTVKHLLTLRPAMEVVEAEAAAPQRAVAT